MSEPSELSFPSFSAFLSDSCLGPSSFARRPPPKAPARRLPSLCDRSDAEVDVASEVGSDLGRSTTVT
eukprot:6026280-Pyramimonas_sp.AAC.1